MVEQKIKTGASAEKKISAKDRQQAKEINDFLIKYFKFIVLLVVLVIFSAGYFFVLQKKYHGIVSQTEEYGENKHNEYAAELKKLHDLRRLKNAYDGISQKDIDKVSAVLPEETAHENILAQVEAIILKNGLILKSLSVAAGDEEKKNKGAIDLVGAAEGGASNPAVAEPGNIGKIKITIDVGGTDYERFKSLLTVLENNLRLMDIENVNFSPAEKSVSLTMYTYFFKK